MKYRSVLSPGARADIRSAVRWYQHIERNLAFRFSMEIRATLRRIEKFPYQFPVRNGTVRRALLNRFPYSVYFRLNTDQPYVLAVVHQRRNDTVWMDRAMGYTEQRHS